jgi:sterol desaturase/sphingolipid hydroxylase (fatty acid hydroxylase superfamily)
MNESMIRLFVSQGLLALMLILELLIPLRDTSNGRIQRWIQNFGLGILNTLLIRLSVKAIAYTSSIYFQSRGIGLLNLEFINSSNFQLASIILTILILDLAIYFQHRVSHSLPFLWRFHKVHHTDIEFDASTSVRFHPIEIIFSMIYKLFIIMLLGANPIGVVLFEIILNAGSTFNHSNIKLPKFFENVLRYFIVTPDMHRIHHSVLPMETNSNYSFSVSIWDRIFKTYREDSSSEQENMPIGLEKFRSQLSWKEIVTLPFYRESNNS